MTATMKIKAENRKPSARVKCLRRIRIDGVLAFDEKGDPILQCPYCKKIGTYDDFGILGMPDNRMSCENCPEWVRYDRLVVSDINHREK